MATVHCLHTANVTCQSTDKMFQYLPSLSTEAVQKFNCSLYTNCRVIVHSEFVHCHCTLIVHCPEPTWTRGIPASRSLPCCSSGRYSDSGARPECRHVGCEAPWRPYPATDLETSDIDGDGRQTLWKNKSIYIRFTDTHRRSPWVAGCNGLSSHQSVASAGLWVCI